MNGVGDSLWNRYDGSQCLFLLKSADIVSQGECRLRITPDIAQSQYSMSGVAGTRQSLSTSISHDGRPARVSSMSFLGRQRSPWCWSQMRTQLSMVATSIQLLSSWDTLKLEGSESSVHFGLSMYGTKGRIFSRSIKVGGTRMSSSKEVVMKEGRFSKRPPTNEEVSCR